MIQLLKLMMILENSRFVGWVTLNAYKIFWVCVCLNLFFNTMELIEVINEAVELAKLFGAEGSYQYVNAVIDSFQSTQSQKGK